MAYHSRDHHLTILPKKETTSLNIAHGLISLAEWLVGIFIPVYLWIQGVELWHILIFNALISVGVILCSVFLPPLLRKTSDKILMLVAVPLHILFYLAIPLAVSNSVILYVLPTLMGISAFLFNTGFNIDYSESTDEKTIGHTVGMRYVMVSGVLLAAPFAGGLLIEKLGFGPVFLLASFLLFIAVLLLFFFPSRKISKELNYRTINRYIFDKSLRPFNLSSVGYAGEKVIGLVLWSLFLYLVLGSIEEIGFLVTLGLGLGIISAYVLGVLTDHGLRRDSLKYVLPIHAAIWVSRIFLASPAQVSTSYVVGSATYRAVLVPWESQYYLTARATHVPEAFVISREVIYSATRIVLLLVLAFCSWALTIEFTFVVSFVLAALFSLLFFFANRAHRVNLDAFIKEGK